MAFRKYGSGEVVLKKFGPIFIFALYFFFSITKLWGQDQLSPFLKPKTSENSFSLRGFFYENSTLQDHPGKLSQRFDQVRVFTPVLKKANQEFLLGFDYAYLAFSHPSALVRSYHSVQMHLGWRDFSHQDSLKGVVLSFGSASDRLFKRSRNNTLSLNYVYQFSSQWWGSLNWSNNRAFLNNIPLPGFFYVSELSKDKSIILGVPFILLRKLYSGDIELQYQTIIPFHHFAKLTYFWNQGSGGGIFYDYQPQVFLRDGRDDFRDRIFFVENRWGIHLKQTLGFPIVSGELQLGRATSRSLFEARGLTQKKNFNLSFNDVYFVSLIINTRF